MSLSQWARCATWLIGFAAAWGGIAHADSTGRALLVSDVPIRFVLTSHPTKTIPVAGTKNEPRRAIGQLYARQGADDAPWVLIVSHGRGHDRRVGVFYRDVYPVLDESLVRSGTLQVLSMDHWLLTPLNVAKACVSPLGLDGELERAYQVRELEAQRAFSPMPSVSGEHPYGIDARATADLLGLGRLEAATQSCLDESLAVIAEANGERLLRNAAWQLELNPVLVNCRRFGCGTVAGQETDAASGDSEVFMFLGRRWQAAVPEQMRYVVFPLEIGSAQSATPEPQGSGLALMSDLRDTMRRIDGLIGGDVAQVVR